MDNAVAGSFARRVVRFIAVLSAVYALATLTYAGFFRGEFSWRGWVPFPSADIGGILVSMMKLNMLLLAAGAIGLLLWRAWGRTCLLIWAAAAVILAFTFNGYQLCLELGRAAPPLFSITWELFSAIQSSVFPALTLYVLLQRDVADLWGDRSRGFEVLPARS